MGGVNFMRGGQLGFGFGAVYGIWEGVQTGLWREPMLCGSMIMSRAVTQGVSFAGYLGVYNGVKCSMTVYRGKNDVINAGVGGACAGSLGALRTRNPAMIVGSAFVGGGIMMVVESLGH